MRPALPTGTVTFLFTDIEGSTRLLHTLGSSDHAAALAEHRRVLRAAFAAITKGTRWIRRAMLALEPLELSRGQFPFIDVPNNTVLRVLVALGDIDAGTELLRDAVRFAAR